MTGQWMQQTTTMAHIYLCNKPARSAHVPQNLKYKKKPKGEKNLTYRGAMIKIISGQVRWIMPVVNPALWEAEVRESPEIGD